ncbi:hypothetical protein SCIM_1316 [Streptococcus intermedius JTH08]|nr:hypothetical protein SCIM_1316 [Streptococcus intermedius JTH08]
MFRATISPYAELLTSVVKKIGTFNARRKAPTISTFAQCGLGVVVIKPYVFEFGSISIGPKEPIANPVKFSKREKNAIVLSNVSIGVVVGNCVFSTTSKLSPPTAQTNFVPPASKLPYNFVISKPLYILFYSLFIIAYIHVTSEYKFQLFFSFSKKSEQTFICSPYLTLSFQLNDSLSLSYRTLCNRSDRNIISCICDNHHSCIIETSSCNFSSIKGS